MDLFLLQKTNEEKDGQTKKETNLEMLRTMRNNLHTEHLWNQRQNPDIVEFMKKWKISVLGIFHLIAA